MLTEDRGRLPSQRLSVCPATLPKAQHPAAPLAVLVSSHKAEIPPNPRRVRLEAASLLCAVAWEESSFLRLRSCSPRTAAGEGAGRRESSCRGRTGVCRRGLGQWTLTHAAQSTPSQALRVSSSPRPRRGPMLRSRQGILRETGASSGRLRQGWKTWKLFGGIIEGNRNGF